MKANIQKSEKSPEYLDLFKSKYRSRTILGILLCAVQQFSGVNAINFYSTKIFIGDKNQDEIDPFDDKMAKIFTILIGI
jgi:Sugar (and other) transporter